MYNILVVSPVTKDSVNTTECDIRNIIISQLNVSSILKNTSVVKATSMLTMRARKVCD